MSKDRYYYIQRAEEELEIAQASAEPAAVKAHYTLAGFYLDRAYGAPDDAPDITETQIPQVGSAFIGTPTGGRANA